MASTNHVSAEAKELSLVEKLELRIANARTDEQLSDLLVKFLAPLLLKLESQHPRVKEKTLRLAQHIQTRLESQYAFTLTDRLSNMLTYSQCCSGPGFRLASPGQRQVQPAHPAV